jgi:hypothetical protein
VRGLVVGVFDLPKSAISSKGWLRRRAANTLAIRSGPEYLLVTAECNQWTAQSCAMINQQREIWKTLQAADISSGDSLLQSSTWSPTVLI